MSAHAHDTEIPAASRPYPLSTHEVTNQPGAWVGVNAFDAGRILSETVRREGAGWVSARASVLGKAVRDPTWQEHAHLANKHLPQLRTHDRFGHRIDIVEFPPSYHALMGLSALANCALGSLPCGTDITAIIGRPSLG